MSTYLIDETIERLREPVGRAARDIAELLRHVRAVRSWRAGVATPHWLYFARIQQLAQKLLERGTSGGVVPPGLSSAFGIAHELCRERALPGMRQTAADIRPLERELHGAFNACREFLRETDRVAASARGLLVAQRGSRMLGLRAGPLSPLKMRDLHGNYRDLSIPRGGLDAHVELPALARVAGSIIDEAGLPNSLDCLVHPMLGSQLPTTAEAHHARWAWAAEHLLKHIDEARTQFVTTAWALAGSALALLSRRRVPQEYDERDLARHLNYAADFAPIPSRVSALARSIGGGAEPPDDAEASRRIERSFASALRAKQEGAPRRGAPVNPNARKRRLGRLIERTNEALRGVDWLELACSGPDALNYKRESKVIYGDLKALARDEAFDVEVGERNGKTVYGTASAIDACGQDTAESGQSRGHSHHKSKGRRKA